MTLRVHLTPIRMAMIKISGENTCECSGNQTGGSLENWKQIYLKNQIYHSWAYTLKIPHHATEVHTPLCSQLICDRKKLDTNHTLHNGRMDTENMIHLHNRILLSYYQNYTSVLTRDHESQKMWEDLIQTLREHKCQPRITIDGETKIFHDKTKFIQYLSTNSALQRIIGEKHQYKEVNYTPEKARQ